MSYDFAVWKRSATTKTAMLIDAYEAICAASAHSAVDNFDTAELERALQHHCEILDIDELPFAVETGEAAGSSWLVVNCPFSAADEIRDVLVTMALDRGLMVYDPQRQVVWGNRRPAAG